MATAPHAARRRIRDRHSVVGSAQAHTRAMTAAHRAPEGRQAATTAVRSPAPTRRRAATRCSITTGATTPARAKQAITSTPAGLTAPPRHTALGVSTPRTATDGRPPPAHHRPATPRVANEAQTSDVSTRIAYQAAGPSSSRVTQPVRR